MFMLHLHGLISHQWPQMDCVTAVEPINMIVFACHLAFVFIFAHNTALHIRQRARCTNNNGCYEEQKDLIILYEKAANNNFGLLHTYL